MVRKCFNCFSSTNLHLPPMLPEFRNEWLAIIPNVKESDLNHNFRLCSLHFEEKYLTTGGRVSRNAVPSKFWSVDGNWYTIEFQSDSSPTVLDDQAPKILNSQISCGPSTTIAVSPNISPTIIDNPRSSPLTPSSRGVNRKFRYTGDIDPSVEYNTRTAKLALIKYRTELDKSRRKNEALLQQYKSAQAKFNNMMQILKDLEQKGIITKGCFRK